MSVAGGVALEIFGYGEVIVSRELLRFSEHLAAPVVALQTAAVILREEVEKQFDTEGGHASGGWPRLADSTVAFKAAHDLDPRILRATGALFETLTRKFGSATGLDGQTYHHIEEIGPSGESLRFGSTAGYGVFHQSSRPRHKIPYRPPIALTEAAKRRMVTEMQTELVGSLRSGTTVAARAL
jgi:phage gpG-like protein